MNEGVSVNELLRDENGRPTDYRVIAVNASYERIIGIPAEALLFKTGKEIHKTEKTPYLEKYAAVVENGKPISFDAYFSTGRKYFRVNAFNSEPGTFATVLSDITEQVNAKKALEKSISERDVLLKELYHRTKNNLQLVSGLIILELERIENSEHREILETLERKIQGIATVHRKLYESKTLDRIDLKEYLEELAPSVVSSVVSRQETVQVRLECVSMEAGIDTAVSIGLIVNELLHNAIKYAVPGGAKNVRLNLGFKDKNIELSVSDDGPGLPDDFELRRATSTGLELAETLVKEKLKGNIVFTSENGAVCRAIFPSSSLI